MLLFSWKVFSGACQSLALGFSKVAKLIFPWQFAPTPGRQKRELLRSLYTWTGGEQTTWICARMALITAILPRASGMGAERAKVKMWLDVARNRFPPPTLGLSYSRRIR